MKRTFTEKLWAFIELYMIQFTIAMSVYGVSMARDTYAQVLDRKVTISLKDVSLETALHQLQDVSGIKIFFSIEQLGSELPSVSIDVRDQPLRDILEKLLSPHSIRYKVDERNSTVIILKKHHEQSTSGNPEAGRRADSGGVGPLPITITGKVLDGTTQQPLAGVNIIVKGTTIGTTTDSDGKYTIRADDHQVLVFSFIGYAAVETQVNGRGLIDIILQEDIRSLNEVVVNAGYWEVKDKEQTGNIAKVNSEDMQRQPVGNPLAALEGRMAGVYIQQGSGVPGSSFTIQIRGRNSLRADGNDPLYVIDGVPFISTPLGSVSSNLITTGGSPLNNINPSDIESIEVLKDADATSVYGSRGSNGVVLITTKKGKAGKTDFSVNFYSGTGAVSQKINLLNTQQYLTMRKEAFQNDLRSITQTNAPDLLLWDTTRYTDWQKKLIGGSSRITNAQASISGGSSNTQFLLSSGYYRETTVFPGDYSDQKFSSHLNVTHRSTNDKFKAVITSSVVFDNNKLPYEDLTASAITLPPNAPPVYDDNGDLVWSTGFSNPYGNLLRKFQTRTTNLISNGMMSYEITKGLNVKANLGYNILTMDEVVTFPIASNNPADGITQGSSSFSNKSINTWIVEPQVEYTTTLGEGRLTSLVGSTFQSTERKGETIFANGFSSDALLENIKAATSLTIESADQTRYRYNGVFGRINYNWQDKYIINLTARRDGSSGFGPDKRFANFGAAGVAWIFSNEGFLRNTALLSFGKIRGSYGTSGSDQIGDYQYLDTYSSTSYPYSGVSGLVPSRLANSDYAWEINKKLEVALDLGFAKDRIQLSVSKYINRSSNQLVGYALPVTTGFTTVQYNLPATVENEGWEIQVSTKNFTAENFSWTTAINFTLPTTILVDYPNISGSSYANTYEVGKSLFIKKAFHYLGVDPETGIYAYEDRDGNGNGLDYPADLQALKEISQTFYGGISNGFRYRSFQLDFLFQFVKQTGESYYGYLAPPGMRSNQPGTVMDRWQEPGDIAGVQMFTTRYSTAAGDTYSYAYAGDNNIVDASFIRLKNVSASWQFEGKWLQKAALENCKIYLLAQNLFTITDYVGLDPENQSFTKLPPIRTVTAGIQLTF